METGSIQLFGKNVVSFFRHHIMSLRHSNSFISSGDLKINRITDSPEKMIDGPYSKHLAKMIVEKNKGKCDVFEFCNTDNTIVGTLSVMYKGGNDIEYKIRHIDAFIYNVYTVEAYRGKGYAGDMIKLLMEYLHEMNIDKAYLAVSTNNESAIRCYRKVGFTTEYDMSFIRILRINIPYRRL